MILDADVPITAFIHMKTLEYHYDHSSHLEVSACQINIEEYLGKGNHI